MVLALISIGADRPIAEGRSSFLDRVVLVERVGPDNSDYVSLHIKLLDAAGRVVAALPALHGPVYLSAVNRQIFACESDSTSEAASAEVFDADGKVAFSFRHLGFLRSCGLTADRRLYWLHYNIVDAGTPVNAVVVLARDGSTVHRERFSVGKELRFTYGAIEYSLQIPPPELPG
jgi:hypothetical protein